MFKKKYLVHNFVEISNIAYQWKAYEIRNVKINVTRHMESTQFQYCISCNFVVVKGMQKWGVVTCARRFHITILGLKV